MHDNVKLGYPGLVAFALSCRAASLPRNLKSIYFFGTHPHNPITHSNVFFAKTRKGPTISLGRQASTLYDESVGPRTIDRSL